MTMRWWSILSMGLVATLPLEAHAGGGRVEATRAVVRPPPPPTRSAAPSLNATSRGTTPSSRYSRGYSAQPTPVRAVGPQEGIVRRYRVVRKRSSAPAVAPPQRLGPQSQAPQLNTAPARPPFRRLVQRYPYEARQRGWVAEPWETDKNRFRSVAGRLSAEGSYQYRGLWRTGLAARVGSPRVDVDTQISFYAELPARDAMYLGDTSLNFAPVALPQVVWRIGLGARYMLDARLPGTGTEPREYAAGWNFTSSIDLFPGQPFIVSARVDRGMLYETPVWRARGTVGLNRQHFELFVGYDHTQVERVSLGGPLVGLRVWL